MGQGEQQSLSFKNGTTHASTGSLARNLKLSTGKPWLGCL